MSYLAPTQLAEALDVLDTGAPSILAGGTDWYPAQGERPLRRDVLDITRIAELRGITATGDGWRIGAATTWSDITRSDLPAAFDGLKAAAREVGSLQIQNAGTIAGNLCNASPAADGVPPLLTLNAQVELQSSSGRRVLDLPEFITGPRQIALHAGEMVTAILIPEVSGTRKSSFVKLGAREYLVISIAMVAASCEVSGGKLGNVHLAVGSCAPVAVRLPSLEAALEGAALSDIESIIAADPLAEINPIDDVRGSGAYRREAARSLIIRAVTEAAHGQA